MEGQGGGVLCAAAPCCTGNKRLEELLDTGLEEPMVRLHLLRSFETASCTHQSEEGIFICCQNRVRAGGNGHGA